jgi:hypothetical protein
LLLHVAIIAIAIQLRATPIAESIASLPRGNQATTTAPDPVQTVLTLKVQDRRFLRGASIIVTVWDIERVRRKWTLLGQVRDFDSVWFWFGFWFFCLFVCLLVFCCGQMD